MSEKNDSLEEVNDIESESAEESIVINQGNSSPLADLQSYSREVLDAIVANNVVPIPANYKIYFEKLLDDKPKQLRDDALRFLEQDENPAEQQMEFEFKVLKVHQIIMALLQVMGSSYENLSLFHSIAQKLYLIHIRSCRRIERCRSRWSPYH